MDNGNGTKVLVRSQKGRMLAGVCAGVADYFDMDVTLVRVIVAVVSFITAARASWPTWWLGGSSPRKARRPQSPRTSSARSRTPDQAGRCRAKGRTMEIAATDPIRRASVLSTGQARRSPVGLGALVRGEARKPTDRRAGVPAPGPEG
jgi:phage shock protein PspC (stress-responsive transcriptional regulator)